MQRLLTWLVGGLVALAMFGRAASAQDDIRSLDVDTFQPTPDRLGFLGLPSSRMPGPGVWNAGLWLEWGRGLLALEVPDGGSVDLVEQRLEATVQWQVGLGRRVALSVAWPLVLSQRGAVADIDPGGGSLDANAAGDPLVQMRFRLAGEQPEESHGRAPEGFGLALLAGLRPPLGTERAFVAEPGARWQLGLVGDFHVLGLGVGALLAMDFRSRPRQLGRSRFDDGLRYGLGLKVPVPLAGSVRLRGLLEVRGWLGTGRGSGRGTNPLVADVGMAADVGDATVWSSVGTGLLGGAGAPSLRAVVGVQWSPRVRDHDGDGLLDDVDECPFLPEDVDGFEDEDGCLDPDDDLDGIEDVDDACPRQAADPEQDADGDGCPDPDRDGDGIADAKDQCPEAAEDADGVEDEDGCPDEDSETGDAADDGVPDASDRCPQRADAADGVEDEDGCPEQAGQPLPDVNAAGGAGDAASEAGSGASGAAPGGAERSAGQEEHAPATGSDAGGGRRRGEGGAQERAR